MRLYPLAIIPLILSLAAIVLSVSAPGPQFYLTVGVAGATFLVSAAILFTYSRRSTEAKQIPLENFSLWTDVGEPAAELRRLSLTDVFAAAQITSTDLASLAANAELLQSRSYMLVGRDGFEDLLKEKMHRRVENLASDIHAITEKINSDRKLSPEIIPMIEQCASQADRIANKFFELEGGKPEVVYLYLEPLRRAAEKLSRDLRQASSNISKYLHWSKKEAPAVPKIEVQPAPKVEEPLTQPRAEEPVQPKAEVPSPPPSEPIVPPEVEKPITPKTDEPSEPSADKV